MYSSFGTLEYSFKTNYSLRLIIDPQLAKYYRYFLPKFLKYKIPMYEPHISVVRKESPIYLEHWNKHEGKEIQFYYDDIEWNDLYIWVNVYSLPLEEIRTELGLRNYANPNYTQPPTGFTHRYHFTIGNQKWEDNELLQQNNLSR
jgi:hypothetical protein